VWSTAAVGTGVQLVFSVLIAPTHTHGGSAGAQSKKLDRGTPDLHRDESDSDIRNWREHEDQEPGVLRPQESASERTSGSDQDGGDAQNVVQSGKPRGKFWCSGYTIVRIDLY